MEKEQRTEQNMEQEQRMEQEQSMAQPSASASTQQHSPAQHSTSTAEEELERRVAERVAQLHAWVAEPAKQPQPGQPAHAGPHTEQLPEPVETLLLRGAALWLAGSLLPGLSVCVPCGRFLCATRDARRLRPGRLPAAAARAPGPLPRAGRRRRVARVRPGARRRLLPVVLHARRHAGHRAEPGGRARRALRAVSGSCSEHTAAR